MQLGFKTPITGLQVAYDYKADHGCWPRHVAHLADGRKARRYVLLARNRKAVT